MYIYYIIYLILYFMYIRIMIYMYTVLGIYLVCVDLSFEHLGGSPGRL